MKIFGDYLTAKHSDIKKCIYSSTLKDYIGLIRRTQKSLVNFIILHVFVVFIHESSRIAKVD